MKHKNRREILFINNEIAFIRVKLAICCCVIRGICGLLICFCLEVLRVLVSEEPFAKLLSGFTFPKPDRSRSQLFCGFMESFFFF